MIDKIKETGIYFIGTIGVSVISFVISLLYTRMFTTEDYGYYSLVAAFYSLLFQLFTGWMTHSILRYYPEEKDKDNARAFRNTIVKIHFLLSICFLLICVLIRIFIADSIVLHQMLLVYAGVFLFEGLLLIFNTFLRAEGKSKQYSVNTVTNSVLKSLMIIVLFFVFRYRSIVVIVVSLLFAEFIQSVYIICKMKWHKIISLHCFDVLLAKKIIKFGYPLIGVSIVFSVLTYSDRFIIDMFGTKSDVGLYSYGYNMGQALFYSMSNAILLGAYPRIASEWKTSGRKKTELLVTSYLNLYFYLMIPALFGVIAVGNTMIRCLCDKSYWDASLVFIITCGSYVLLGLLQYTNKAWELNAITKPVFFLNLIAAAVNIVLNLIFVPIWGYIVAAITTGLSFALFIGISLVWSRKIFTFKIDFKVLSRIFAASVIMGGVLSVIDRKMPLNLFYLMVEIVLGMLIYIIMLFVLRDDFLMQTISKIRKKG